MANRKKVSELKLPRQEGVSEDLSMARAVLRPPVQAASSLLHYETKFTGLDLTSLVTALTEETKKANDGDMSRAEEMLISQSHILDSIFNNLAQRAALNMGEYLGTVEIYLKLALRAQSQCRSSLEALSAIKNPPVAGFVGQANIAHGPQQVNNGPIPDAKASGTEEKEIPQNELLEEKDGERLVTRATGKAGRTDKDMATVGTVDRANNK